MDGNENCDDCCNRRGQPGEIILLRSIFACIPQRGGLAAHLGGVDAGVGWVKEKFRRSDDHTRAECANKLGFFV